MGTASFDLNKIINEEIQNYFNDNFWKWFGHSKVVDRSGKPLRVYHCTREVFDTFKSDEGLMYFSKTPKYASQFATNPELAMTSGKNSSVLPVYLSIQNPLDLSNFKIEEITKDELINYLWSKGVKIKENDVNNWLGYTSKLWQWLRGNSKSLKEAAKAAGYDGMIIFEDSQTIKNITDKAYVAFEPTQIKSATGNNGEFNSTDPSIIKETPIPLSETTYKVYHGTNNEFDRFDFNKTTQGIVWFTDSIDSIKNQEHGGAGNKFIMTRYITINKPAGWDEYEKYGLGQLRGMGYDGVILPQGDKTDYFVFSNKSIRKVEPKDIVQEEIQNMIEDKYHGSYPQHRGELTFDKIVRRIKGTQSLSTKSDLFTIITPRAYQEIIKFNSPQELMDNIYWHGSGGGVSGGLMAGFNIVKNGNEGGGGGGEQYHSISVSRSKNKASNFTGMAHYGMVYPVLLRKGATVEDLPELQDANEVDDILVDLWQRKVDAVKIGNWSKDSSEEELVILNPKAILKFQGEGYPVYNKERFTNPDINVFTAIYNTVKNAPPIRIGQKDVDIKVKYENN